MENRRTREGIDRENGGGIFLKAGSKSEYGRFWAGNEPCQAQSPVREGLSILFFVMRRHN